MNLGQRLHTLKKRNYNNNGSQENYKLKHHTVKLHKETESFRFDKACVAVLNAINLL